MTDTSYQPVHIETSDCDREQKTSSAKRPKARPAISGSRSQPSLPGGGAFDIPWNRVLRFLRESYHSSISYSKELYAFITSSNWRHRVRGCGGQLFPWILFAAWIILTVRLATRIGVPDLYARGGCTPASGFLPPYQKSFNKWDVNNIFQITVGFGKLRFSTAKFIDVAWDVVVGRGGQAVLVAVGYVVFTSALTRVMETASVSYGTFTALTFEAATLSTILRLTLDFLSNPTL